MYFPFQPNQKLIVYILKSRNFVLYLDIISLIFNTFYNELYKLKWIESDSREKKIPKTQAER